jgi:hypothetical protein
MNPHMPKSGLRSPTPTIPRCFRPLSALGLSVSFGPSSFQLPTSSSTSDIPPTSSTRYVFLQLLGHFVSLSLNEVVCDKKSVTLLFSYPICKLWARYLPNVTFFGVSLNPGPFTIKEHVIIVVMGRIGIRPAYAVSAQVADYVSAFTYPVAVIR